MHIDDGKADERKPLDNPFVSGVEGNTPLDEEEKQGLIPSWVTFRHELNEIEQENIAQAVVWVSRQVRKPNIDILNEQFIRSLHRRMLGDVWKWAGTFRASEKNIGVAPYQIAPDIRNLLDDAKAWLSYETYSPDESIARFHHRLVEIHPFPNGNGRHARLMADLLARRLGVAPFTWGGKDLATTSELRTRYIDALRLADRGLYDSLIEFMRS
jgi:Fic-DOC domain mobile mystery protein B